MLSIVLGWRTTTARPGLKMAGATLGLTSFAPNLKVQLFRVALDGRNFDHLTSLSTGGLGGSGLGIAPSA